MRAVFLVLSLACALGALPRPSEACGRRPDRIGHAYVRPANFWGRAGGVRLPFASAALLEGHPDRRLDASGQSLPFGVAVEVTDVTGVARDGRRYVGIKLLEGGVAYLDAADVSATPFWQCGFLDALDGEQDRARRFADLPAVMVRGNVKSLDIRTGRPVDMDAMSGGARMLCRRSFVNGNTPSGEVECWRWKYQVRVSASDVRVPTPDEMAATLPGGRCHQVPLRANRAPSPGATLHLLPRSPWPRVAGADRFFEMVPVYERTGPETFAGKGLLPYGAEVVLEETVSAFGKSRGYFRVKEFKQGDEYFVDPADVQDSVFWRCDVRELLAVPELNNMDPFASQVPVRIVDAGAVAVDYTTHVYVGRARLAALRDVFCDAYDDRPNSWGPGSRPLRCSGGGASFTIDPSGVAITTPEDLYPSSGGEAR